MAITRSQQAKQMLQDGGMLVKPSTDGKRPGYSNPNEDRAREEAADRREQASVASTQGKSTPTTQQVRDIVSSGPDRDTGLETIRKRNIETLKDFKETKPPVKFPKFTPSGFIAETFFKKPLQKFSNFTTAKNRAFFENVIRAGKIPGVTFADLQDPNFDLEEEYQEYMANRMAGKTDAYGNPVGGFSYDSDGNLVGSFRDDGSDPIPFIPPVEDDTEEDDVAEYVNPLSLLTPRIAGTIFAADGGRIGFKGGADMGTVADSKGNVGARSVNVSPSGSVTTSNQAPSGPDDRSTPEQTMNQRKVINEAKKQKPSGIEKLYRTGSELNFLKNLATGNFPGLGKQLMFELGKKKFLDNQVMLDTEQDNMMLADAETDNEKLLEQLFNPDTGVDEFMDKKKESEDIQQQLLQEIQNAADGGRIGAMDGGIMNVEDLDREAFLLGGIAKGLKKAVRGVKKIAKSPIGKAALLYGLGAMGGSFGSTGKFFSKGMFNPGNIGRGLFGITAKGQAARGLPQLAAEKGLFGKLGLTEGYGALMPTLKGGITLASILPLLAGKTDEEKNDILKDYYAQNQLEPATTARQMGSKFDFYKYNLAEGGMPEKEPVAKKTMPLLDMDGKEKDYRETGGFVDMGRMERADDVPARLSKNEFVFTADAVRNAGEGDIDKGSEVMYNMMKNLEAGGEVSEESQGLEGAREMFQTSQRLGEVI